MCVIAVKHFPDVGWVGVKNRDRNYKPSVRIRKLFRGGVERLVIWDEVTRYTEGVNEHGVCIISAATDVKKDESIGNDAKKKEKRQKRKEQRASGSYYAPDGRKIRNALLQKSPREALEYLIEKELRGSTLVFNADECYLMEGSHEELGRNEWKYVAKKINKSETVVRTNHGIWVKFAGYQHDEDPEGRESSEARLKTANRDLKRISDPYKMMDALASTKNKNWKLNPLRTHTTSGKTIMKTTGQLLLVPSELTLHYRPIWGEVEFDFNKLDNPKNKTAFEIVSARKLISFKESLGKTKFKGLYK